ncbi:MAG: hypothetical protein JSV80_02735, partial [Acidobacteriota bacterium]
MIPVAGARVLVTGIAATIRPMVHLATARAAAATAIGLTLVAAAIDSPTAAPPGDAARPQITEHRIEISLEPGSLRGTAELVADRLPAATLDLILGRGFRIEAAWQLSPSGAARELAVSAPANGLPERWRLEGLSPVEAKALVRVSWTGSPPVGVASRLDASGAFLAAGAGWFPTVYGASSTSRFRLAVLGPASWRVASAGRLEVDEILDERSRRSVFNASEQLEGLWLVAAARELTTREHRGIQIAMYHDQQASRTLVQRWLLATAGFIDRFTSRIGPYPSGRVSLFEWPSSLHTSGPSLLLLTPAVLSRAESLRAPLAHALLHQWWGHGVYLQREGGDWSEGLTSYMAEHALAREQSPPTDEALRREWLRVYSVHTSDEVTADAQQAVAGEEPALAGLAQPIDAQHQPLLRAKAAMVFHMLRREVGEQAFDEALRMLYAERRHRRASWSHLQRAFERAARRDLDRFFDLWLKVAGAPQLRIDEATAISLDGQHELRLRLETPGPWQFEVPFEVFGAAGERQRRAARLEDGHLQTVVRVAFSPRRLTIDPEADLLRRIDPAELAWTVGDILSGTPDLAVLGTSRGERNLAAGRNLARSLGVPARGILLDRELTSDNLRRAPRISLIGRPASQSSAERVLAMPDGARLG